ncbi:MAG TPA: carboxypeptidase regulatory-like domain-containing protein [Bryobacteraceae bacterium]|nr:carboxypeptidase regulatory-like domain-containing protein [Bryobacteraceae bacterium]
MRMAPDLGLKLLLVLACIPAAHPWAQETVSLEVSARTEQGAAVPEAKVTVRSAGDVVQDGQAGSSGDVRFAGLAPGAYRVGITAAGFQDLSIEIVLTAGAPQRIDAVLAPGSTRTDSITVVATAESPLEQSISASATLARAELKNTPDRPASVADALPLAPAILRLPNGQLSLSGSAEHRSTLLVNSGTATDPATGQFGASIPIDSVQTMNVLTSPFLTEYGGFTSNVVAVETRRGGDKWHFELNDPLPEFRFRSWHMVGMKSVTPRINFGGPLLSSRLHLVESIQYEMHSTEVITQPFPNNQQRREGYNSFTSLDYILNSRHILTATFHIANQDTRFANLDAFNSEPVTPNAATSTYAVAVSDRMAIGGAVLESALAATSFRAGVWPQGTLDMILNPSGNQGNYFSQQSRNSSRLEWRETFAFTRNWLGVHNLKFGSTIGGTAEHGLVQDHPVSIADTAGTLLETIRFTPGEPFQRSDVETAFFAQDHWVIGSRFAVESGIRAEQQRITDTVRIGPRAGFGWTPFGGGHTIVRAGAGLFYDRVPLNVYGFPAYPNQIITSYGPEGQIINGPTQFYNLTETAASPELPFIRTEQQPGNFAPYSVNWNVQIEQILLPTLRVRASYLQSRSDDLIVLNPQIMKGGNALVLNGNGTSQLKQLEVTAATRDSHDDLLYISYVRTHAAGSVNDFNNYLANFPPPVILPNYYTSMPGDVPNRFLTWGTIHLPWKLQVMPKVEYRTGFPYSSVDARQQYVGIPNQSRFPGYLSVDARISKDIKVSDKYTLRFSVIGSNLTDHFNPISVHANTADPLYGVFFGEYRRRYTADFDVIF